MVGITETRVTGKLLVDVDELARISSGLEGLRLECQMEMLPNTLAKLKVEVDRMLTEMDS